MEPNGFYHTKKYCPKCHDYVRFLQNLEASYCVACGARVRLFNAKDKRAFVRGLAADRKRAFSPTKKKWVS